MTKALPKADNAIIAEHEAGKHDVYNGGYPTKGPQPGTCRECAKAAKAATTSPTGDKPARVDIVAPKTRERRKARAIEAAIAAVPLPPVEPYVEVEPGVHVPAAMVAVATSPEYRTREEWMLAAVESMRPWIAEVGAPVGPVRISFGWPGGRGSKKNVRGQCWMPEAVKDRVPSIFVSPAMEAEDTVTLLGIILHEMNHAAGHFGHVGPFAKTADKLGFVKPWTSSEGKTDDLKARLSDLAAVLGPLDHAAINAGHGLKGGNWADPQMAPPVQSTRMLKVWCPEDGYTLRATAKWLNVAVPSCPVCDAEMTVERKS